MRITIRLPDDILEKVALDALRKRRNSKEAVITEVLRAHYGGGQPHEKMREALQWRIPHGVDRRIREVRRQVKQAWR